MRTLACFLLLLLMPGIPANAQDRAALQRLSRDPGVSAAAREYYEQQFGAGDDPRTFSILDSMVTRNAGTRPFYLYLATRMMQDADGALAEELGARSKGYVLEHPAWALEFLQGKLAMPASAQLWAKFIAGELSIDCEGAAATCAEDWYRAAQKQAGGGIAGGLAELYRQVLAALP